MVKIIKKEVVIDDSLKKKITTICKFCNTKPTIINDIISYFAHAKSSIKLKSTPP